MTNKQTNNIKENHDNILKTIQASLADIETDAKKMEEIFYSDPAYKSYQSARNDKGYRKWKEDVIKRFENHCCICYSGEKLVAHHLYGYQYYPELRTEINNGVCICNNCHELFNYLNSNKNTLELFVTYRKKFIGKSHAIVKKQIQESKRISIFNIINKPAKKEPKISKNKLSPDEKLHQDQIVLSFEELRQKIVDDWSFLRKMYGNEKGIQINFRDRETTSLSAIDTLGKEIARLNTLIKCNKVRDKTTMASLFHTPYLEFCKKIQDPKEYLNFSPSEITHLNKILKEL